MNKSKKIILSVKENLLNIVLFYKTQEKDYLIKYLNNLTLINSVLKQEFNIEVNIEKTKNLESINKLNENIQSFYDFYLLKLIKLQIDMNTTNINESLIKLSDIISELSIQRIKET